MVLKIVPGAIASLISAGIILLTGCVPFAKAYKTISWVSVIMIAAMIPMGIAIQKTGTAELISNSIISFLGKENPTLLVAGIFLLTTTFSQFINKMSGSYRYLTNFNFIKKSKMNVSHHYDISDDLYDLFLDPKRQYSCAYFKNENDTLEEAQNNKIQHIIKKLNIKPNQKVLDIGCGWGSLAIDIAQTANCEVTGITLSENQFNYCNKKAKELNLENQLTFKLVDYRQLNEKFDRIVSVGMFEHVGRKFYKKFFKQIDNLLKNDGISLIHTIGSVNPPRDPHPWITKYIFPGGYTPSLSEVTTPIEKAGLIVSDIEVLKLHYSHTLRHWKENCNKNKDKIIQMFDEKFFRMWEFYLTSCEIAFKYGDQVVYQFQLAKNYTSTPTTRDYIYQ